ncbi:MAG: PAS domain-containing protein, partial [Planctomycetes bacterium]|nr:PAS domain-containing protein [Planctomycetota bacterium]
MRHIRKVATAVSALWTFLARRLMPRSAHVPFLVGLTGLTISLTLWRELNAQQSRQVERSLQSQVASATHQLKGGLDERIRVLAQIAQSWDLTGEQRGRQEVSLYAEGQRGCVGVAHIGPDRVVRWFGTSAKDSLPPTLTEFGGGQHLDAAIREGVPILVRPLRSRWHNAQVLLLFAPFELNSSRGGLLAVMQADQWIETILNPNVATGYALAVTDGGEEVYTRLAANRDYFPWQQSLPVNTHSQSWRLHAWPTQDVMDAESSPLPGLALAVGLLAALLLALAAHMVRTARRHASEMEAEIEERKAAQSTLSLSEALHRSLTENLDQGVFLKDRDGKYTAANSSFCREVGRPEVEVIGRVDADLFDEATALARAEDEQLARTSGRAEGERETRVAGRVRIVRHNLTLLKDSGAVLGITWDVTDQRSLEAQFRQAQKMEAFGQLAGGVAHDFNNLLTVINGYSEMLMSDFAVADPRRELAADIRKSGERAAALTAQLLAFSRKTILEPKILDMNQLVDQMGKMLRRLIGEDVVLLTELTPTLKRVKADPGQIEQVIMNLAVNARDAMPKGGRLIIATKNLTVEPKDATLTPDQSPGSYVQIAVSDTGTGMTDEVKAKIFEPFYTTKAV